MEIKNLIPFWGCLIISAVYGAANDNFWALLWMGFALFIIVMDSANKKDDTDRYA